MKKYEQKIYQIVDECNSHLTAEEIFQVLRQEEPKVVRATVYNNLNALYAERKIHKVSVEGMPDRYDRMVRHDHLVCPNCSRLTDIEFPDLTGSLNRQLGESIEAYDLKVLVLCPECRAKTM